LYIKAPSIGDILFLPAVTLVGNNTNPVLLLVDSLRSKKHLGDVVPIPTPAYFILLNV
jgi:hypothetical protein